MRICVQDGIYLMMVCNLNYVKSFTEMKWDKYVEGVEKSSQNACPSKPSYSNHEGSARYI